MTDLRDKNRLVAALRALVAELAPAAIYSGDWEYIVQSQSGAYADLTPADRSIALPALPRVRFRGAPGVAGTVAVGCRVLVRFINSDPGRPYIAAVEGADGGGFVPVSLRVDASSIVRVGESAEDVELGDGAARVLRDGEAVSITATGAVVSGGSGSITVRGTISRDTAVAFVPGAPPTGYSRVKA